MKKILLALCICVFFYSHSLAQGQYLPDFQFGIKGGGNFTSFPSATDYKNKGQIGYLGGVFARFGGLGFNFQPELYVQKTSVTITDYTQDGGINKSYFTTLNVPLLFGEKIGDENFGIRFYTGPELIFRIQDDQQFANGGRVNYQDQNYSWQLGGGIDLHDLSIDIRYEAGINKLSYGPPLNQNTRMNLINITLSYSLFSSYSID